MYKWLTYFRTVIITDTLIICLTCKTFQLWKEWYLYAVLVDVSSPFTKVIFSTRIERKLQLTIPNMTVVLTEVSFRFFVDYYCALCFKNKFWALNIRMYYIYTIYIKSNAFVIISFYLQKKTYQFSYLQTSLQ